MTSRSSRPARCQHKPSASCPLCQPVCCQHKSSASCSKCQRERNDLQEVGAWAHESRDTSIDNASFLRDSKLGSHHHVHHSNQPHLTLESDPEALRTTTPGTKTPSQPHSHPQSKQPSPPTQHHQQQQPTNTQRPYSYKHHPSISPPSTILSPRRATTPSSSIIATCPVSPTTPRTVPIYSPRQTLPATTNTAVVARRSLRTPTPQTASPPGSRLPTKHVVASDGEESSEEESDEESEEDDESDDE
jgi:hypothetical protein